MVEAEVRRRSILLAALVLAPSSASAHPYDEVVQGAYLTLAPGEVRLELDISPGPMVASLLLRPLDANGDQVISNWEARAYAEVILKQTRLTVDGAPAALRFERVVTPSYADLGSGDDTLKIYAVAERSDRRGEHLLSFENRFAPAKSQCATNIFLLASGPWRYRVIRQLHSDDGRRLSVRYATAHA